ncbi:thiolase family protein [Achromobacter sp. Marseille-Q0513]|uniref:thiolase family protein n=1 Tax=Achromobacter sp. Marseille-Q0513 TaxID=2829161 RepID=UPI001B942544|nr:thiolase family protein [Achromobacter sp. Marseille-Q0513]MBR8655447.1 thiolase family protein [Achromobacter sp. Marseille-Q0513]
MTGVHIPYGVYWSTPFARWQGSLSRLHSLRLAAWTAARELARRGIDPAGLDAAVLGYSVPQQGAFYGLPWVAGMMGAPHLAGPVVAQACATSVRGMATAAADIMLGQASTALVLMADRVSNGPQLYHPDPAGPGGSGAHENWVLDNFSKDPWSGLAMLQTGERVAQRHGISTAEQNAVTLRRYEQYAQACADERAFQRRYMTLPFELPDAAFAKTVGALQGDEGIHTTTAEGLARLAPVLPDGSITYGGQTHPADGNAGMLMTTAARARALSRRPEIGVEVLAFGQSRTETGYMPQAPIEAARRALDRAGLKPADLHAVKTHNPFVVSDIALARATGLDVMEMNNYGCSLVWGHPQAPTGLRSVIELIEELAQRGGGLGLFTGCAAGDSAMAVALRVDAAGARP